MPKQVKELLYCSAETHSKIKHLADDMGMTMIKLLDLIMDNIDKNDCIKFFEKQIRKNK